MNAEEIVMPVKDKLGNWMEGLITMLPNIVAAIVVLVIFWIGARLVRSLLQSLLRKMTDNAQVISLLATLMYLGVLFGGVMVALGVLQLEKTVTSLLAGVGIVGLALGFAFQDLAANLMAGVLIATSEPLGNGDMIRTGDYTGIIESVRMRYSVIRTFDGQLVRIPNKQIFENPLENYTQPGERRVNVTVGVSYGDDLEKARRLAIEAVESIEERNKERDVELYYTEFGDSSINFTIRFWIAFPEVSFLGARSEAIMRIKETFDTNGITIPFPIRTLDFGIVGGEKLSDVIPFERLGTRVDQA